jgi:hypothetical protein
VDKSTLQQQARKWTDVHHPASGSTHCPTSGTSVCGYDQTSFLIPDGYATWWHCSACEGWHVLILKTPKKLWAGDGNAPVNLQKSLRPQGD